MGLQINLGLQQQLIVLIVSLPLGLHPSPLGGFVLLHLGTTRIGPLAYQFLDSHQQKTPSRLGQRCKKRPQGSHEPQGRFWAHGLSMSPLIFVHVRLGFHYFQALYLGLHNVGKVPQKMQDFPALVFQGTYTSFCIRGNFVISHALSEYLMCVLRNKFN